MWEKPWIRRTKVVKLAELNIMWERGVIQAVDKVKIPWNQVKTRENAILSFFDTMWKFQDFSITDILRVINFKDSRSAKSAILTHLEPLNYNLYEFLHFLKPEIYLLNKIQSSQNGKNGIFCTFRIPKFQWWKNPEFSTLCMYLECILEHAVGVPRQLFQLQIEQYWFCPGNPHWK